MNWEVFGATGEWAGAIAVVATLFYLARQIRQQNDIARFSTAQELLSRFDEFNSLLVTDQTLRELLSKESDITAEEEEHVYTFTNIMINVWLSVQEARNAGQIEEELFEAMIRDVSVAIERWPRVKPQIQRWLKRYPEVSHYRVFEPLKRADDA